jgi:hypothetical protein
VATVILGSYMVRYPLGGMASWVLQYLLGFQRLGHEIWFVEKGDYPLACFDPRTQSMTDDPATGTAFVADLLRRWGLEDRWCFVDAAGRYHGADRARIEGVFGRADVFVDMGTHGSWAVESERTGCRVLLDGEPAFTQMKMELRRRSGAALPAYDLYFSTGQNVGTPACSAPDGGVSWRHVFHPVVIDLFEGSVPPGAALTTVMNWQSYDALEYDGRQYGHKDVEFPKFAGLPGKTARDLEVAVSGEATPVAELTARGWKVSDAQAVTATFDSFRVYLQRSWAEFAVCKSGFVVTRTGWFGDRTAAYLAAGRPAVVQDTGFSDHLPCGAGLFAVTTEDEAADAIASIESDYGKHSRAAMEIAREYLDAKTVLAGFLAEAGV